MSHQDVAGLRDILLAHGMEPADTETLASRLRSIAGSYEPYVAALTQRLIVSLPAWLPEEPVIDDWRSTAWDPSGRAVL